MTFAQWQASRGILPWPEVHARAGQDLRTARALRRFSHRLGRTGALLATVGCVATTAAIRAAHFAELAEHQAALVATSG